MLVAFHKPYGILTQFTPDQPGQRTLAEFGFPMHVWPIGRLDQDSEGLLLLSDEKHLVARLLEPRYAHRRRYAVQVEHAITPQALAKLERGVTIQGRTTLPCRAWKIDPAPIFTPRDPPIRVRQSIPTSWIALELTEGKNRQVRRMTAAVGHPTLRLVRTHIGQLELNGIAPGSWRELGTRDRALLGLG
jgi:23S rRNA pseudouridine2457 synthase